MWARIVSLTQSCFYSHQLLVFISHHWFKGLWTSHCASVCEHELAHTSTAGKKTVGVFPSKAGGSDGLTEPEVWQDLGAARGRQAPAAEERQGKLWDLSCAAPSAAALSSLITWNRVQRKTVPWKNTSAHLIIYAMCWNAPAVLN